METAQNQHRPTFRQSLQIILHDGGGRLGHAFNFFLTVLILLSVALLPVRYLPSTHAFDQFITVFEAVIVGMFTIEYFLRVYAAPKRLRYVFSFFGIVDLLSIMPFYTNIFHTEAIRALRFVRFFKLSEMEPAGGAESQEMMQADMGLAPDEIVEYVVTKHPLFLLLGCIPPGVALSFAFSIFLLTDGNPVGISAGIVLVVFALVFLWKTWLDFSYDVIYLTNQRLIFQDQNILGRSINQMNYSAITNVKPSYPSAISYIFRYGTLTIDTAAENPGQVSISMIRQHEHAAQLIMQKSFATQNK